MKACITRETANTSSSIQVDAKVTVIDPRTVGILASYMTISITVIGAAQATIVAQLHNLMRTCQF